MKTIKTTIFYFTTVLFFLVAAQMAQPTQAVANVQEETSVEDHHEYEMCLVRVYGRGFARSVYGIHVFYPDGKHIHHSDFDENAEHPASVYEILNELSKDGWRVTSNALSSLEVGGMRASESTVAEYILERRK